MKTINFVFLFCLLFFNCSGQDKQKSEESTIKPNENVQVNKEYDEFGNLIRYDSIYSYSYSSNSKLQDSLKQKFQQHFNQHSFFNDSFFDDFFKPDSLSGNFNPNNFFYDGFMNHDEHIKSMMQRMDSIQKLFFNQNHGNFNPKEPNTDEQRKI